MIPIIPCPIGHISPFPRATTFPLRKENQFRKWKIFGKSTIPSFPAQRFPFPQSIPIGIIHHRKRNQILATIGTDVAVEEPNSVVEGEDIDKTSEVAPTSAATSEASSTENLVVTPTAEPKRPRPVRKSDMPPVKNEELILGATFTGKVRSVQPFGAFVDFGAFTDGLVHVSQLSDSFVKDVGSFVSVGQEVKVRLLEANFETGRISLTMREGDDLNKLQQRKDASSVGSSDKPRPARRNTGRSNQKRDEAPKSSKFVKGQVLDGTVKNLTRAGAFISLPEGEEGFLPTSEEFEGFGNVMGSSSLLAGQEVNVRVLRITRGQVTLTMKKEEDMKGLNLKLNQGVVHVATNPFELAFRKNEATAAFLEERERVEKSAEILEPLKTSEQIEGQVEPTQTESNTAVVEDLLSSNDKVNLSSELDKVTEDDENPEKTVSDSLQNVGSATETIQQDEVSPKTSAVEEKSNESNPADEAGNEISSSETVVTEEVVASVDDTLLNDNKVETEVPSLVENDVSSAVANVVLNETPITTEVKEDSNKPNSPVETADLISSSESEVTDEVLVSEAGDTLINNKVETEVPLVVGNEMPSAASKEDVEVAPLVVENEMPSAVSKEDVEAPLVVENEMPSAVSKEDVEDAPSMPEQNGSVTSDEETDIPSPQGSTTKATVSPALVKQLREETGAGMMDCKKALAETGGDIIKAQEFLRKKGLASADKKASRATAEGRIGSYVHDTRIGVLIEVNCETDFVSRGDIFKQLVDDLAMQVAACPQVQYLVTEDVPEEIVNKEREIEMQKEDLLKKPEQIRSKIVEGRIRKRLEEFTLLEQPYIKNDKMVVKDWVKQTIATIGENIKVRRFARYNLGEGLEKKSQDFAAEVAAQTATKAPPVVSKDQSAAEAKETFEKPPTVAVSAVLVKQLREETGAGMMDCKKALTETGGNLEKAQEYLRKKGLSTADKKSSRLAAEGRIGSYIHDSRIGVLIEVNCETDFVGRSEKFKELVIDLAMQVVACPQVQFVSVDEIPENIVSKERELEMQREDIQSKPENIREKIVEGRISKRLREVALLEQPFIKNDSVLVKDLVKQTVAGIGENIKVRRFVRFALGEAIEGEKVAADA